MAAIAMARAICARRRPSTVRCRRRYRVTAPTAARGNSKVISTMAIQPSQGWRPSPVPYCSVSLGWYHPSIRSTRKEATRGRSPR
jgi:hypothetical protein